MSVTTLAKRMRAMPLPMPARGDLFGEPRQEQGAARERDHRRNDE
jgi:hypothetical protein